MALAPAGTFAVASGTTLPIPLLGASSAGWVPSAWGGPRGAIDEIDLIFRGSTAIALTDAAAYEIYQGAAVVVADDTFTTTFAANTMTATAHGLRTGTGPLYLSNAGGALPAGLAVATPYWAIFVDANTIQLATSLENALRRTAVAITDDGTGTHTWSDDETDVNGNGITSQLEAAQIDLLGNASDGAITLAAGSGGYTVTLKHRYGVLAYAVYAVVDTGTVTVEMRPRGRV